MGPVTLDLSGTGPIHRSPYIYVAHKLTRS